jgi:hypothetical protein
MNRRTAPKVKNGRVQKKNKSSLTPDYGHGRPREFMVDRQRPGKGYRHLVTKRDLERFVALLPDWDELSDGLEAIVLAPGKEGWHGWHYPGVVALCAWPAALHDLWSHQETEDHRQILDALDVETEPVPRGRRLLWTEDSARAFQLLHVLLHELGHHHDRVTTRTKRDSARGEPYAEKYANRYGSQIFEAYFGVFGY